MARLTGGVEEEYRPAAPVIATLTGGVEEEYRPAARIMVCHKAARPGD